MKKFTLVIFSLAAFIVILDQFAKFLISNYLQTPIKILPFFSIESAKNYGIAFSLPVYGNIAFIAACVILAILLYFAYKTFDFSKKLTVLAIGFILGGAISNIIDRIAHGYVIDYIDLRFWPVFNIADIFITIGILSIIFFYGKIKKAS